MDYIKLLHNCFLDSNKVSTDTRKVENDDIFFALKGDNFNGNKFALDAIEKGAKYAVIDESEFKLNDKFILVEDVLTSLQQLAKFHRNHLGLKIIALTGSNGKTTTKELIHSVLKTHFNTIATKGNLNNHIGVPLTLLSMDETTEIGVVEMGANHLKEIEFLCSIAQPDYGYITNFGKAHLEGFGGVEGVIKGKSELYDYLRNNDKLIFLNSEDKKQVDILKEYGNTYTFGGSSEENVTISFDRANPFVSLQYEQTCIKSRLFGSYNFTNICAAIAIGDYFKIDLTKIKEAIESYIPENNRSQIINKSSNKIILDAYNANPTSMVAALDNFALLKDERKVVILGDMFELGNEANEEHNNIAKYANSKNIDNIYLVGENFFLTNFKSENVTLCKSFEDLKENLTNTNIQNTTLLIKGSRGMALERVLDLI